MGIEHAFDSMLQYLPTGGFLQSRAHCYIWSDIDGNPSSGRAVAMAYDFKKEFRGLYRPPGKPSVVTVSPMSYVAVRGKGDPNAEGGA